ncbi:esterase family protein [Nocardia cyriacigeorgica]|uniref:Esterase family protein n=1 Tax=Nocardia cyriacigeorgica TaxID=135487 RepID=A0A6P1D7Y0_9NOCA|nr:esterase family protein [Nocardia cyriacigeorgica]NEW52952.1 esterase family protein [Nocardia cyriacigeorgica]
MYRLPRCLVSLLALSALLLPTAMVSVIFPAPAAAAPGESAILSVRPLGGRELEVVVHSAAMNRPITLWMSHPGAGAPTLYLLNAVDGGEDGGPWTRRTDVAQFFSNKHVNVVVPMSGRASYYTDWLADDPVLGRNQWETFLSRELPPLLADRFQTTGRNAVAGLSMSATSALNLAIRSPGLYQAVGAFSGCTRTSDPMAVATVFSQLGVFGANAANMWGPPGHPAWADHDPMLHLDRLRGLAVYVSSGNGGPGAHETLAAPDINGNPVKLADRMLVGGVMETFVSGCTRPLVDSLAAQRIPATVNLRQGTHAWAYWQDDLHQSWSVFAPALGV